MNQKPKSIVCSILACVLAAMAGQSRLAWADDSPAPVPPASPPPATQQADSDPFSLVTQLGAADAPARDAAAKQLRDLGKNAVPALKYGSRSANPDIKTRCLSLIKEITGEDLATPPKPGFIDRVDNGGVPDPKTGLVHHTLIFPINPPPGGNAKPPAPATQPSPPPPLAGDQTFSENGVVYTFHSDADGLVIVVTTKTDSTAYRARDIEDLQKNQPDGYKVYLDRFAHRVNGGTIMKVQPPVPQPAPATPPQN